MKKNALERVRKAGAELAAFFERHRRPEPAAEIRRRVSALASSKRRPAALAFLWDACGPRGYMDVYAPGADWDELCRLVGALKRALRAARPAK